MYSHVQLNSEGEFLRKIPALGNVLWDENNFCPVFALVADGKGESFNLKPYYTSAPPTHNADTEKVRELDPAEVSGNWTQQWEVVALTPEERTARVPQAITMRQARLVLLGAGKLAAVDTAIANISDETTRKAAQIEWEFSNELQRHNTFVTMLSPALNLTSEQVDQLFIAGSKL